MKPNQSLERILDGRRYFMGLPSYGSLSSIRSAYMKHLIVVTLLFVIAASCVYGDSLHLDQDPGVLRNEILKKTPIGTSFFDACILIKKLKPKTLYIYDNCPELPSKGVIGKAGVFICEKWPPGIKPQGKSVICLLGGTDRFPPFIGITLTSVGAWWGFDNKDRLIDIFIYKKPDVP